PDPRTGVPAASARGRKGAARATQRSVLPPQLPQTAAATGATALPPRRHTPPRRQRFQTTRCPESPASTSARSWNQSFLTSMAIEELRGAAAKQPLFPCDAGRRKSVSNGAAQPAQNAALFLVSRGQALH